MTEPTARFDQPLIAIDVVPITFPPGGGLLVGTTVRQFEPYAGRQALPGVLLGAAELLVEAAGRALTAKAGIGADQVRHLRQIAAFDGPGRDPRSHALSIAFLAVVEPGAGTNVVWHEAESFPVGLPFDHDMIVAEALATVRTRLFVDDALTAALTGPVFTTTAAAALSTVLTGAKPHAGNFHRMLATHPSLAKGGEAAPQGRGRRATLWAWVGRGGR